MATITNADKVNQKFARLAKKAIETVHPSVSVGYTANYAIHVHENIEMKWRGLPRSGETTYAKITKGGAGYEVASRANKGNYWDGTGGATGQAKFLEQPFRELRSELASMIVLAVKNGATLLQALYIAGLRLQRESQLLVPVVSGNLKASAFTRKD